MYMLTTWNSHATKSISRPPLVHMIAYQVQIYLENKNHLIVSSILGIFVTINLRIFGISKPSERSVVLNECSILSDSMEPALIYIYIYHYTEHISPMEWPSDS